MTIDMDDLLKNYGHIQDADRGMHVRVCGFQIGTGVGWFHFNGGWSVMVPEFQPNDWFRNKYVDAAQKYDEPVAEPKGLVIEFYLGRMALVTHPYDGQRVGKVTVLWEGAF